MAKIAYSADGTAWRDITPTVHDPRDLDESGKPKPGLRPAGEEVEPAEGERVFDHVLSEEELAREFPQRAGLLKRAAQVEAVKQAALMASHDDAIVDMILGGQAKASDFNPDELAAINARRATRGKKPIT